MNYAHGLLLTKLNLCEFEKCFKKSSLVVNVDNAKWYKMKHQYWWNWSSELKRGYQNLCLRRRSACTGGRVFFIRQCCFSSAIWTFYHGQSRFRNACFCNCFLRWAHQNAEWNRTPLSQSELLGAFLGKKINKYRCFEMSAWTWNAFLLLAVGCFINKFTLFRTAV